MPDTILFTEKQKFTQWWFWLILVLVNGIFLLGCYYQLVAHRQFGDDPVDNSTLITITIFVVIVSIAIASLELETQVRNDGIYVRFLPFQRAFRFIPTHSIRRARIRVYNPIMEYGGWGFRLGLFGSGTAYNISGNEGLQLEFTDGRKLLIGTQKSQELAIAIRQLNPNFGS